MSTAAITAIFPPPPPVPIPTDITTLGLGYPIAIALGFLLLISTIILICCRASRLRFSNSTLNSHTPKNMALGCLHARCTKQKPVHKVLCGGLRTFSFYSLLCFNRSSPTSLTLDLHYKDLVSDLVSVQPLMCSCGVTRNSQLSRGSLCSYCHMGLHLKFLKSILKTKFPFDCFCTEKRAEQGLCYFKEHCVRKGLEEISDATLSLCA
ncbi:hypothetical protein YC2023_044226 [Brassica napus]